MMVKLDPVAARRGVTVRSWVCCPCGTEKIRYHRLLAKSLRGRPDCVVLDVDLAGHPRGAAPALHPCTRSTETTRLIHWWWGHWYPSSCHVARFSSAVQSSRNGRLQAPARAMLSKTVESSSHDHKTERAESAQMMRVSCLVSSLPARIVKIKSYRKHGVLDHT